VYLKREADPADPSIEIMPLPLGGEESTEPERVGRNAANLAVLLRAGFSVPEGWVLPVEAFSRVLESARASDMSPEDAISSGALPADLLDAIVRIAKAVASPVAVRSSALAEDLPGASYAGLYETILGVEQDQIEQAVRRCWASAFAARVSSYAGEASAAAAGDGHPGVAVLVQTMVPADSAGIVFTANPVTGDRAETVVAVTGGLGERLVSGETTGEDWSVRGELPAFTLGEPLWQTIARGPGSSPSWPSP
jgi:pyruvate,water dikinase